MVYNLCESQAGANFRYSFLNSLILPHKPIAEMTRRGTDMIFFDSNKEFFAASIHIKIIIVTNIGFW